MLMGSQRARPAVSGMGTLGTRAGAVAEELDGRFVPAAGERKELPARGVVTAVVSSGIEEAASAHVMRLFLVSLSPASESSLSLSSSRPRFRVLSVVLVLLLCDGGEFE